MATYTFVNIDEPYTADLADLWGIQEDLTSARAFTHLLQQAYPMNGPQDMALLDALSTAIVIRYCRPFSSGRRLRLEEETLAIFSPEQRAKHDHFSGIRDKHAAHAVSAFEESQPLARYTLERVEQEGITSITVNHAKVVGLSHRDQKDMIELTTTLIEHVGARIAAEQAKILTYVRSFPVREFLADKKARPPRLNSSDPQQKRPDLRNPKNRDTE